MGEAKIIVPLKLSGMNCCGELFAAVSDELEERGRKRKVHTGGPPAAAASDLLPEL